MTKEKTIVVLMLIATLMGYVRHNETTLKISKLRKHIRLNVNRLERRDKELYDALVKESSTAWKYAQEKINNRNFEIVMSETLRALWYLIEPSEYRNIWFTDKTILEAIGSMEGHGWMTKEKDDDEVIEDSNELITYFQEALGLSKKNKLSYLKSKVTNELILEGKIK